MRIVAGEAKVRLEQRHQIAAVFRREVEKRQSFFYGHTFTLHDDFESVCHFRKKFGSYFCATLPITFLVAFLPSFLEPFFFKLFENSTHGLFLLDNGMLDLANRF